MRIEQLRTLKARGRPLGRGSDPLHGLTRRPDAASERRDGADRLGPLVMRVPGLRRTPLGKAIELVGGAPLVVKLAERIRGAELRPRPGALG